MAYIGQTKKSLKKRWQAHCRSDSNCSFLRNAIQKYGKNNFTIEVVEVTPCPVVLDYKEKFYIKEYNTISPNGYNIRYGGSAPYSNKKGINAVIKSNFKGKTHTAESRLKMSLSRLGVVPWNKGTKGLYTPEYLKKISRLGKKNIKKRVSCG